MTNTDILQGNWKSFSGQIKEQWAKLTDNDLQRIDGKRDQFIGHLQQAYGYSKQQAQQELEAFEDAIRH